jgi:nucleoside 2-deoxyribosyltransferase
MAKYQVYLAAPLFSLNERHTNRRLAQAIEAQLPQVKVLLPQDIKYHNKFNDAKFFREVYQGCLRGIESSHACIAMLDGPSADDGTCFEVGYAAAKGIPVIGVRTDYRKSQELGCNLMLSRGCKEFVFRPAFDENFDFLSRDIVRKLRKLLKIEDVSSPPVRRAVRETSRLLRDNPKVCDNSKIPAAFA